MIEFTKFSVSIIPVFVFLIALVILDSYKLVSLRSIFICIIAGLFSAIISLMFNSWLIGWLSLNVNDFSRFFAPAVEEILKSFYLVYLIRARRIGFAVDATIYGFAIGAGFALVENIYYLHALTSTNILLWILRGFGTAVMHGSTVAIMGMISNCLSNQKQSTKTFIFFPGLFTAVFIHMMFNLFFLPPLYNTIAILIVFPLMIVIVFSQSEKTTRNWLGLGMDADVELLEIIASGQVTTTNIGRFLNSLKSKFDEVVVADMLCYLRIYLELAVGAKGLLMMQNAGFIITPDLEIKSKLEELKYLEKSIGKTGKLAIMPLLHSSDRDAWQLYLLGK